MTDITSTRPPGQLPADNPHFRGNLRGSRRQFGADREVRGAALRNCGGERRCTSRPQCRKSAGSISRRDRSAMARRSANAKVVLLFTGTPHGSGPDKSRISPTTRAQYSFTGATTGAISRMGLGGPQVQAAMDGSCQPGCGGTAGHRGGGDGGRSGECGCTAPLGWGKGSIKTCAWPPAGRSGRRTRFGCSTDVIGRVVDAATGEPIARAPSPRALLPGGAAGAGSGRF